jgi:hypothetical protein
MVGVGVMSALFGQGRLRRWTRRPPGRSPFEAYTYLYPLVMMDVTRRQMTNSEPGKQVGFGPANAFTHVRAFPPIEFKAVPWANFDTLYSLAWLDLTAEPLILSVPDTGGRYYLMPLQDMWTDVFAGPASAPAGPGPIISRSYRRAGRESCPQTRGALMPRLLMPG